MSFEKELDGARGEGYHSMDKIDGLSIYGKPFISKQRVKEAIEKHIGDGSLNVMEMRIDLLDELGLGDE